MPSTLALAIAATLAGPAAGGFLTDPEAQAAFDRAMELYRIEDYGGAEQALAEAYAVEPAAELLFARAQMLRRQGDCAGAIDLYRAYLATSPPKSEDAEEAIARCQALIDTQPEPAHAEPPPPVPPPEAAPPPEPHVDQPDTPTRWYADPAGGVLFGTGVVGVAIGAALVPIAIRQADEASGEFLHQEFNDRYRDANRTRIAGISVLAVGAACIVAGIVRYAVVGSRSRGHR